MLPQLLAIAGLRSGRTVSNDELASAAGVTGDWIGRRTGILSRRHSTLGAGELARRAAASVLAVSGLPPTQIDQVIAVTESSTVQSPPLAPAVASAIGAAGAGAFDLVAACAGFGYGLGVARDLVVAGSARTVLVVAAEQMSIWLDCSDAHTAPIFGDGAGAAIVGSGLTTSVWPAVMTSDGSRHGLIGMRPESWRLAFDAGATTGPRSDGGTAAQWPVVRMDGPAVFRWVVSNGPSIVDRALERAGVDRSDVDVFVPHQANLRVTTELARRCGLEHAVLADDVRHSGNTSSASIPLAIADLLSRGLAAPGQRALLFGFGAGMTAATQLVVLPERWVLDVDEA